MPKTTVSHRLDDDLVAWASEYAKTRGVTRSVLLEEALRSFQALSAGGVPVLSRPAVKPVPTVVRASSLEARRRANPAGLDRQASIERNRRS